MSEEKTAALLTPNHPAADHKDYALPGDVTIRFQKGAMALGRNGVTTEEVLDVLIDHLGGFQKGTVSPAARNALASDAHRDRAPLGSRARRQARGPGRQGARRRAHFLERSMSLLRDKSQFYSIGTPMNWPLRFCADGYFRVRAMAACNGCGREFGVSLRCHRFRSELGMVLATKAPDPNDEKVVDCAHALGRQSRRRHSQSGQQVL
jgi:hypothetical protein